MSAILQAHRQTIRQTVRAHGATNPRLLELDPAAPAVIVDFDPTTPEKMRSRLPGELQAALSRYIQVIEPADLPARQRRQLLLAAAPI